MIGKILDFCIRERLLIVIASVAVVAYGWYSTKQVPLDAIPNVSENQVIKPLIFKLSKYTRAS